MLVCVASRGYAATTVAHVIGWAGVSRATFYQLFDDKEDCFVEAHADMVSQLVGRGVMAYENHRSWEDRIRGTIRAIIRFLADDPAGARVGVVEVIAAGPKARQTCERGVEAFMPLLEEGRPTDEVNENLSPRLARIVVGGINALIFREVVDGRTVSLPTMLPQLVYVATVPYVGHKGALRAMRDTEID